MLSVGLTRTSGLAQVLDEPAGPQNGGTDLLRPIKIVATNRF